MTVLSYIFWSCSVSWKNELCHENYIVDGINATHKQSFKSKMELVGFIFIIIRQLLESFCVPQNMVPSIL